VVIECALARKRNCAPLGRASQRLNHLNLSVSEEIARAKRRREVCLAERHDIVEERCPRIAVAEPGLPVLVEPVLDLRRKPPEGHRTGGVEELLASGPRDAEDDTSLGETVRPRKPTREGDSAMAAEHPVRVPPARPIHLAITGDDQSQLEESIEVDHRCAASRVVG
jgi:hypothetical protein